MVSQDIIESDGGVVFELLACRARGPGLEPRPRHLDSRDWVCLASSHDMNEILLKQCKILKTT